MKRIVMAAVAGAALLGAVAVAAVAQAGGGGHYLCGTNSSPVGYDKGHYAEVAITDNCFGPIVARVAPGTEVRWTNKGNALHNVADVTKPTAQPTMLQAGTTLSMKFDQPGAFIYHCSIHPGMMGVVFVGDEASQDVNPELVASATSASVLPPKVVQPEPAAAATAPLDRAATGVSPLTVALLALAVGTVAGAGSTLLAKRLDNK